MKTNYFDKNGNYINVENLSLADIYHRAFAFGVESVDVRPQGKWISQFDYSQQHKTMPSGYGNFWWCNKCDSSTEKKSNFCPNCGADMRGNQE